MYGVLNNEEAMDSASIDCALDNVFLSEQRLFKQGYNDGLNDGRVSGCNNGFQLGIKNGATINKELGFYKGFITTWMALLDVADVSQLSSVHKTRSSLLMLIQMIDSVPRCEPQHKELHTHLANIRAKFRQICSLLNLSPSFDVGTVHGMSF